MCVLAAAHRLIPLTVQYSCIFKIDLGMAHFSTDSLFLLIIFHLYSLVLLRTNATTKAIINSKPENGFEVASINFNGNLTLNI